MLDSDIYQRVGEITRKLHDALRELGYDKQIEASLGRLPDARSRLSFIARLTGEAAEKVLDTVDAAQAHQQSLADDAARIEERLHANPESVPAAEVAEFVARVRSGAERTSQQLTDIMLAQDFHDLTGQTVRKVVDTAATLETSLLQLLIETAPVECEHGVLDGPVADPSRTDVVANQEQVDDLLESLGF